MDTHQGHSGQVFPIESVHLREELCESIVEMCIYRSGRRGSDFAKMKHIAKDQLKINLDLIILKDAATRLEEKKVLPQAIKTEQEDIVKGH